MGVFCLVFFFSLSLGRKVEMGGRVHKGFSSGIKMVFLTEVLEQF